MHGRWHTPTRRKRSPAWPWRCRAGISEKRRFSVERQTRQETKMPALKSGHFCVWVAEELPVSATAVGTTASATMKSTGCPAAEAAAYAATTMEATRVAPAISPRVALVAADPDSPAITPGIAATIPTGEAAAISAVESAAEAAALA